MNKVHSNVNWENYPSSETPINEQNLNKMDNSIDEIDNRVIVLDNTKANKTEVAQLIKDISFDENTGIFVITKKDGSAFTIDTKMEKIAINFSYDTELQQIILTLIDGTIERIDLSDFVTQYEFLDTDTISFYTDMGGNVSAIVKEGSIEEKHLQPNYLAEIKIESEKAQTASANATKSEINAKSSETIAKASEANARQSELAAVNSSNIASEKASEAATSAINAANSSDNATQKANAANVSATNAANSATTAMQKATIANTSATNAENYSKQAQSYAIGTGNVRPSESTDNAKYYYEQSKDIYDNFSHAGNVTGVKGNAENSYRTGNINLTSENIGAVNKAGDIMTGDLIIPNSIPNTSSPTLPASGSLVLPDLINLRDYRSFLGTYSKDGNSDWNYLINIRHRNGFGDGNLYGMYIKAPLSGNDKNLSWGFQHIEEWSKERTILDSVNYKRFCTPENIGLGNVNNTPDYLKHVEAATYLTGWGDTRNVETTPNTYSEKFKVVGLKTAAASKITTGSSFATLLGIRGWSDSSAGKAHELAFDGNGKLLHRVGLTSWESWKEIAYIDDTVLLSGGTMNENAIIHMKGTNTSIDLSAGNNTTCITNNSVSVENNVCQLSFLSKIENTNRCGLQAFTKSNSRTGGLYFYNGDIFPSAYSRLNISITKNPEIARSYTFDETGLWSISEEVDLGKSSFHWRNIYANNGTIQTSDRTKKTHINSLEIQKVQAFIHGLNPVSYKMLDGTSGRTHYGFIAQDIEELMNTLNMDSSDFAGFIKSPKKIIKYEDENGTKLENPIEEVIENEYDYALRYDEFIAPLIKVVQEQQKTIEQQQEEIEKLKQDIEFLKQYLYQS